MKLKAMDLMDQGEGPAHVHIRVKKHIKREFFGKQGLRVCSRTYESSLGIIMELWNLNLMTGKSTHGACYSLSIYNARDCAGYIST